MTNNNLVRPVLAHSPPSPLVKGREPVKPRESRLTGGYPARCRR